MSEPAQVGKAIYNETIGRGRVACIVARNALNTLLEESPGPQTTAMLIAKIAVQLGRIDEAITTLEQIGERARNWPTEKVSPPQME